MSRSRRPHQHAGTPILMALVFLLGLAVSMLSGCEFLRRMGLLEAAIETPEDAIRHIEKRVRQEMRRLDIPGFAIAVVDDQSIVWEGYYGVGNLDAEDPVTADTIFRVGSISKVFTAMEVMRLRDEGLVNLDSPIEDYLSDFDVRRFFQSDESITVRSLLTHRSGLPRNGTLPLWYWDPGAAVLRELVGSLKDAYAVAPPWTRYKYSNIGYVTLGLLIEELRGGLWPYYMQRELLRSIGMNSSAFVSEGLPAGRTIATGYFPVNGENAPGGEYDIIYMPSGNLHSTVGDLAAFMQFLFRDGRVGNVHLIQAETLNEMYRPDYSTDQDPQMNGLGWFTDDTYLGERVVFHDGTNSGTISYFAMVPGQKLGLVICATSNAFESVQVEFVFEALDILRQGMFGIRRATPDTASGKADESMDQNTAFEGTYIFNGERLDVAQTAQGLFATMSGFALPLSPESQTRFTVSHKLIPGGYFTMDFLESGDAVVKLGGTYAIYAPRYPVAESLPATWEVWLGSYEVQPRLESRYNDTEILWTTDIVFEDGLIRSGDGKVLLPVDATYARIMGGPFEGEIMERDSGTGAIEWSGFRLLRVAQ